MSDLIIRRHSLVLRRLPVSFHRLRILHVSDLHLRTWTRLLDRLQDILRTPSYDFLMLTGDFCVEPADWRRATRMIRRLLDGVRPPLGAFAVLGNHDGQGIVPGLQDAGVRVLRNELVTVNRGSDTLNIAGVEQTEIEAGDVISTLAQGSPEDTTVLLAHYPSTIHQVPDGHVDLVLSGHTHAGQLRLPVLGCLWAHDGIAATHAWGLHRVNNTYMHVSAGIGVSGPLLLRMNCPPEVTHLLLLAGSQTPGRDCPP